MILLILLMCLFVVTPTWAGEDFAALKTLRYADYVDRLQHFRTDAYEKLVVLKNPGTAMSDRMSEKLVHEIEGELTALAIEAGKTQDQDFVDFQTKLESVLVPDLDVIKEKRKSKDKTYYTSVEKAAKDLRLLRVPYVLGGSGRETGADFYAGSRPVKP